MNADMTININSRDGEKVIPIGDDVLKIMPLGAGQEVGRSCIILEFKQKTIMLDFGIHPALFGIEALPYVDRIDADKIDLLLISHYHLDHAGGIPWFLMKTTFKGRCFATHATKAIYRWLLADYIKVSGSSVDHKLYDEADLEKSMDKIEMIDFHQVKEVGGIRFWCYNAGHVLGAAMFMIEIAGVKILYTGDFSRQEDRHLMSAEIPGIKPDVLIIEATYGTHIHDKREDREARFTGVVYDTVTRGGRCLIPVFALGRAQELLLILDEYWSQHPELHDIPIYYASALAKKCMAVYQTFIHAMNDKIRSQCGISNPFMFKHISNLKSMDHFVDSGPCVVMASPGMMQNGLSRELFETWCPDRRNTCIIAGYCVEGTLAKQILQEPEEITSMQGGRIPRRCQVEYISFSAHTDYLQTSEFIRVLRPPIIVLVHGEANEMNRLRLALEQEYESDDSPPTIYMPRNTTEVVLPFKGEQTAKVVGFLAMDPPFPGHKVSGVLVKRNFHYHLMDPSELSKYTNLTMSTVNQRLSVYFRGSFLDLIDCVGHFEFQVLQGRTKDAQFLQCFKCIIITLDTKKHVSILEWIASPVNDMYADAVVAVIMKADSVLKVQEERAKEIEMKPEEEGEVEGKKVKMELDIKPKVEQHKGGDGDDGPMEEDEKKNQLLFQSLQDMFSIDSMDFSAEANAWIFTVDDTSVLLDLENQRVECDDDHIKQMLSKLILCPDFA